MVGTTTGRLHNDDDDHEDHQFNSISISIWKKVKIRSWSLIFFPDLLNVQFVCKKLDHFPFQLKLAFDFIGKKNIEIYGSQR